MWPDAVASYFYKNSREAAAHTRENTPDVKTQTRLLEARRVSAPTSVLVCVSGKESSDDLLIVDSDGEMSATRAKRTMCSLVKCMLTTFYSHSPMQVRGTGCRSGRGVVKGV